MSRLERIEHKRHNQLRKLAIMKRQRSADETTRNYWAKYGLIQDGKYTPRKIIE